MHDRVLDMKRYCLTLDLQDEQQCIAEYISYHQSVWPEVIESIKASGIKKMEIFNAGNRLFMIIKTANDFSFERKAQADAVNEKVQAWEHIMLRYQKALPFAKANEKWVLMERIFDLR